MGDEAPHNTSVDWVPEMPWTSFPPAGVILQVVTGFSNLRIFWSISRIWGFDLSWLQLKTVSIYPWLKSSLIDEEMYYSISTMILTFLKSVPSLCPTNWGFVLRRVSSWCLEKLRPCSLSLESTDYHISLKMPQVRMWSCVRTFSLHRQNWFSALSLLKPLNLSPICHLTIPVASFKVRAFSICQCFLLKVWIYFKCSSEWSSKSRGSFFAYCSLSLGRV